MSFGSAPPAQARIPNAAVWLGALGLIPFLAGALAPWLLPPQRLPQADLALIGYGAVILSFLGGVHWGLAAPEGRPGQLGFSVLPSLVGWLALLVATFDALGPALWLLAAAFATLLPGDLLAAGRGLAPGWYPRLRLPLTLVVVACLIVGVLA
ncbi:MAG: DUF3429 domain-containing protein [Kiloniellales bacterium]|nr:DUF3429 domain-containing protein [Kiloniellales bacterium]